MNIQTSFSTCSVRTCRSARNAQKCGFQHLKPFEYAFEHILITTFVLSGVSLVVWLKRVNPSLIENENSPTAFEFFEKSFEYV